MANKDRWKGAGLLSEIRNKIAYEFRVSGREQAKLALAMCVQAKNATLKRCGVTPEQASFSRLVRWFSPSANEEGSYLLPALGSDVST